MNQINFWLEESYRVQAESLTPEELRAELNAWYEEHGNVENLQLSTGEVPTVITMNRAWGDSA